MFVITGASGNTGSVIADTLLARGMPVRLVARTGSKLQSLARRGAEIVAADLRDAEAMTAALRGARAAYLILPSDESELDLLALQREMVASLQEALRVTQPGHVVLLSSIGAQHASGTGPVSQLGAAEGALAAVQPNFTSLRASYFMENFGPSLAAIEHGGLPTLYRPEQPLAMIATRDVGSTAAELLLVGGQGRAIVELEAERRYSMQDAADELTRLLRKSVAPSFVPESAIVSTMIAAGRSPKTAELHRELAHAMHTGLIEPERGSARAVRGTTPLSHALSHLLKQRAML